MVIEVQVQVSEFSLMNRESFLSLCLLQSSRRIVQGPNQKECSNNACILYITIIADTELPDPYSPNIVITSFLEKRSSRHIGLLPPSNFRPLQKNSSLQPPVRV